MRSRRWFVLVIAAGLLAAVGAPATTASTADRSTGTVIRDVVIADIAPTGTIRSTQVAELVRLRGSASQPASATIPQVDLAKIRSLSGFNGPASEDGSLVWRTTGSKDIVALAKLKAQTGLPVKATLHYFLDGKPVTAARLKGASGTVRIQIDVQNNASVEKTLTFTGANHQPQTKTVKFYLPFEFTVLANFSGAMWSNLVAPLSYVQTDASGGENVIHPGVLNPVVGPDHDTVTLEATGRNIRLPHIQIAFFPRGDPLVAAGIQEQVDKLGPLYDGLNLIDLNMGKVKDGTVQLAGGLDQILAGIGQIDPTTGRAEITLDSSGQPTTLVGGLGFMQQAVRSQLLPGIGSRDASSGRAKTAVDPKGVPTTLLYGLQNIKDSLGQAAAGVEQLKSGVFQLIQKLDGGPDGTQGFRQGIQAMQQLVATGSATDPNADFRFSVLRVIVDQLLTGLGQRNADGSPKITLDAHGQPSTVIGGLGAILLDGLMTPGFYSRQAALGGKTPHDYILECPYCFDPTKSIYNPKTAAFQPHLGEALGLLSEGLGTLISKVNTLNTNDPGVVEGLTQMNDGLVKILGNLQTFDPAHPGLVDGLQLLSSGVGQLSAGVGQLKSEGVDVATAGVQGGVDDVSLRKAIIAEQNRELQTYSFLGHGATGGDGTSNAFTTFLFDLAAQNTLPRDTLVRIALIMLAVLVTLLTTRRMRLGRFVGGAA